MEAEKNKVLSFDIPVVLFTFKRLETLERIIERVRVVKPIKFYIISDGPRNSAELPEVLKVRKKIEELIDWECSLIKNYAEKNRGVYENIGMGAKWVLGIEEYAIFLEDDNLPEVSFFEYCRELLLKYKDDNRVMWICGTNYLEQYAPYDNASYMFTKHLLPCGWASWKGKFENYYDAQFECLNNKEILARIKNNYTNKSLFRQQMIGAEGEIYRKQKEGRFASWDYQMALSLRANEVFGISPCYNQIENIGVDNFSIHGGNSYSNTMTRRFCSIKTFPLKFPLKHPEDVFLDFEYEHRVDKIILFPLSLRIKGWIIFKIKKMLFIPRFEKLNWKNIKYFCGVFKK